MKAFENAKKGDWVQIQSTVLQAQARSGSLPPETRSCDYMMNINGFLEDEKAVAGDDVIISTLAERKVTGRLVNLMPGYENTFGSAVPELIWIGADARKRVAKYKEICKNSCQASCEKGELND